MGRKDGGKTGRGKKVALTVIIAIGALVLISVLTVYLYSRRQLDKINYTAIPNTNEALGINSIGNQQGNNGANGNHNVTNLLLLGVDKLENASDSIIVLTIDNTTKVIKMSSLMRDSYIEYGKDMINKLNYAYHYGGPLLSIKTVNQNYNLDIRDYVKVDFGGLVHIIDALGGVNINIASEEIKYLNYYARDIAAIEKIPYTPVTSSGLQKLNGEQAVSYSRIRYVGLDFQRTERQREVLNAMFDKVKDLPITSYPGLLSQFAPFVETSLSKDELMNFGKNVVLFGKNKIEQFRIPLDNTWSDLEINGIYYLRWDHDKNIKALNDFIYFK